jgi:hypothetical protein
MDTYLWDIASMFGTYTMGRHKQTVEELEKQLEQLKKDVDKHVEMSLVDRLIYSLQHSVLILEDDVETLDKLIEDLKGTTGAGGDLFRLHITIFKSRKESSEARIEKYKKRLVECVKQLKDYNFATQRKELDQDIEAAKKQREVEAEEAKKAHQEADGNPQIA